MAFNQNNDLGPVDLPQDQGLGCSGSVRRSHHVNDPCRRCSERTCLACPPECCFAGSDLEASCYSIEEDEGGVGILVAWW